MKYTAIEDCAIVERDTEQDDLLLRRLEKSVRVKWTDLAPDTYTEGVAREDTLTAADTPEEVIGAVLRAEDE